MRTRHLLGVRCLAPWRGYVQGTSQVRDTVYVRVACDDGVLRFGTTETVHLAEPLPVFRCDGCGHWRHEETPCSSCAAYRYAKEAARTPVG